VKPFPLRRAAPSCVFLACLTLTACAKFVDANGDGIADAEQNGRAPDTVSLVAPSNPVGTLSGVVVNSLQVGIESVDVTLVLGEGADASHTWKTQTTRDGAFFFKDLPAGAVGQVILSKTGYSGARFNAAVPGAAGNFPINDGNGNVGVITLAQLSSTVKFRVFTALGVPAKGARAFLEVTTTAFQTVAGTYGAAVGNYSGSAEVDEFGVLSFTNAPDPGELARINNANYVLTIGALDLDNDMRADILGTSVTYNAVGLFTQPDRTIVLTDARTTQPLQILATNLDSFNGANSPPYRNALKTTDTINIVFNQPITQADTTRLVKVVQEDCSTVVPVNVTQRTANVISIAGMTPWTLGARYNIIVRATGLDSGATVDFIGYFFAIDPTVPRPLGASAAFQVRKGSGNTMSNALQPGDTLNVVFDSPITNQGGPVARAYVNFDLNGDGQTGGMTGLGEFNGPAGSGFQITNNEQTQATDPTMGTFTCKQSGYSSRWSITIGTFPATNFIPSATQLRVVFPRDNSSSDTFQTAWGQPVVVDPTGTLTVQ